MNSNPNSSPPPPTPPPPPPPPPTLQSRGYPKTTTPFGNAGSPSSVSKRALPGHFSHIARPVGPSAPFAMATPSLPPDQQQKLSPSPTVAPSAAEYAEAAATSIHSASAAVSSNPKDGEKQTENSSHGEEEDEDDDPDIAEMAEQLMADELTDAGGDKKAADEEAFNDTEVKSTLKRKPDFNIETEQDSTTKLPRQGKDSDKSTATAAPSMAANAQEDAKLTNAQPVVPEKVDHGNDNDGTIANDKIDPNDGKDQKSGNDSNNGHGNNDGKLKKSGSDSNNENANDGNNEDIDGNTSVDRSPLPPVQDESQVNEEEDNEITKTTATKQDTEKGKNIGDANTRKGSHNDPEDEESDDEKPLDLASLNAYEYERVRQYDDQAIRRYEQYRRSDLKTPKIRKVLAALNPSFQKVSEQYIIALKGLAKMFVGDVTEKALEVKKERGDKGPLLPVHLREAYRRLRVTGVFPSVNQPAVSFQ